MTWKYITNIGSRAVNEDCVRVIQHGNLMCFVVADGLGGHGNGEVASALAVEAFNEVCQQEDMALETLLSAGFERAQTAIIDAQKKMGNFFQAKTTLCVLLIRGNSVVWGHIGDSRLYAFARNKIRERTLDHSVPQMLVLTREIKEEDIRNHPDRNRLLKVLGTSGESLQYSRSSVQNADKFQAFLLCSDGFWELVWEKEMCKSLKTSRDVNQWLDDMCRIVEVRSDDSMDNYSAIAIWT